MRTLILKDECIRKGPLILINPSHPVEGELAHDLVPVAPESGVLLEKQAAKMLCCVFSLLDCGQKIAPVSGYRSLLDQQQLYSDSLNEHGEEFTRQFIALPGCSEHQSGLAVDLAENKPNIDPIRPYFPHTGICQNFREKAPEYGFIERYPKGREHITHIAYEPWHFRYVGYPHSALIKKEDMTLEEYTAYLKRFRSPKNPLRIKLGSQGFALFSVPVKKGGVCVEISDKAPFLLSGNNEDGCVVTVWSDPA